MVIELIERILTALMCTTVLLVVTHVALIPMSVGLVTLVAEYFAAAPVAATIDATVLVAVAAITTIRCCSRSKNA